MTLAVILLALASSILFQVGTPSPQATLTSGGNRVVGTRNARVLMSAMPMSGYAVVTGDPAPNPAEFVPMQSLWIDTDSLLPLRWELFQRQAFLGATDFVYEALDLTRPAGFEVPTCIP